MKLLLKNKKGAIDEFKKLVFGFIFLTLFIFLLLTFVVNVSTENNVNSSALQQGAFNLTSYNQTLSSFEDDSQNLQDRFQKGSIWSNIAGVVVTGIFGIGKSMIVMITTPFSLVAAILIDVLHIPAIVVDVLLGVILLSIIFGIWALIKKGD